VNAGDRSTHPHGPGVAAVRSVRCILVSMLIAAGWWSLCQELHLPYPGSARPSRWDLLRRL